MSGIEVAGLVLGAVPLLISALEHYGEGVGTIERWWKYRRELAAIRRLLLAEQSVFQGTIERLLNGIVLDPELEDLLENSGRGSWSRQDFGDLDKKLNRRLGRSYASFEECVENINHVVAKLREDLELSENGKVGMPLPLRYVLGPCQSNVCLASVYMTIRTKLCGKVGFISSWHIVATPFVAC